MTARPGQPDTLQGGAPAPKTRSRLFIKYVALFKNYGSLAGQEFDHPVSQITATTFVPRRVLYELRASRDYYYEKERCVFCDTLNQEMRNSLRIVESHANYVSLCPFASRVPLPASLCPA